MYRTKFGIVQSNFGSAANNKCNKLHCISRRSTEGKKRLLCVSCSGKRPLRLVVFFPFISNLFSFLLIVPKQIIPTTNNNHHKKTQLESHFRFAQVAHKASNNSASDFEKAPGIPRTTAVYDGRHFRKFVSGSSKN